MFKKIILILFFSFTISNAYALRYYSFKYKTDENESFSLILKKFVKDTSVINAKTPMVIQTVKSNPLIKDWDSIPSNTVIELFISNDFADLDKLNAYQARILKAKAKEKAKEKESAKAKAQYPAGLKGSVFFMSSMGSFVQKSDTVGETKFSENSPVSLGGAFSFSRKDSLNSASFSAYLSYLFPSQNSLTSDKIAIPPEIGGNLYGEHRLEKYKTTLYSGLDYEKFSVFNLQGMEQYGKIYLDSVSVTYLTFGIAEPFSVFNKSFFTKISVSQSLFTTYQNNAPSSTATGKYSAHRFLFYLNYKYNDKLYIHTLLKYNTLSGPSDISIFRIGIGFGYVLF